MQFCTICGKPLQPGFACDCQVNQQFQQQPQYQQPPPQYQQTQYQQPQQYQQTQYQQPPPQYQQPYQQYPQQNQYYGSPYQAAVKPPGQTMIRVIGILCTIFGGLALIGSIEYIQLLSMIGGMFQLYLIFSFLMTIAWIVAGILGIVFASKRDKAGIIIGCGATIIGLKVIDLIWALSAFGNYIDGSVVPLSLVGMVLPILLIVGGTKRKNAPF